MATLAPIGLHAVGLLGPGLRDFAQARPALAGREPLIPEAVTIPPSTLLPANERRRTTQTIRLAMKVAEEATEGGDRERMRSVFASSSGDMDIIDRICAALTEPEPMLSPTQFHNSVHNAAAGNWSIATANPAPATALSAFDATLAAGLLEAATLQLAEGGEVLLVAYDVPSMDSFREVRPVREPFAVALRLGPCAGARWQLGLDYTDDTPVTPCVSPELEALRQVNPAARVLPLLERLARDAAADVTLPAPLGRRLGIRLEPLARNPEPATPSHG